MNVTDEERFYKVVGSFFIVIMVIFFAVLALVGIDLFKTDNSKNK
jgi:hypothetical protein